MPHSRPALRAVFTLAFCLLWLLGQGGALAVDYDRDVRPILAEHCWECHSGEDQNGGLRLDAPAGWAAATDSGKPTIVPGKPQESELLRRILATHEDERMPPAGQRLSADQVELLTTWIAAGAVASATSPIAASLARDSADSRNRHWAFQPLASTDQLRLRGDVRDPTWAWTDLDRFIQFERERHGLQVTCDATPGSLARRVAYGLTGLPPTPTQLASFEQMAAQTGNTRTAQMQLVDELLSSPSYGERWGRHWMDWVRYADTAGDNSDFPIPQAYLYRNYVIDAFNNDLPYDRFLTEQLAGDLLPAKSQAERNRQLIATGYLALARRFGSLIERYPWHLTIEDTIDNIGRSMLGLTIACARCHDHKFDPISARDYYGLYGIFASTRYPMPGLELFQAQQYFQPLLPAQQAAEILKPRQAEIDKLNLELTQHLAVCHQRAVENAARQAECSLDEQRRLGDELDALLLKARKAGEALAKVLKTLPPLPTAYAVQDGQPADACLQIKGEPTRPGAQVPRKFLDVLGGQQLDLDLAAETSGRLQLAQWITHADNPLTARVIVNRVWQRHFGNGLVATTSDFGLRGVPPTHPLLIDYLATELINSGWSIKHLQRLILNSRTYQLSSQDVEDNLARDPANDWYWRANRQRLDAESLRDTLLLLGGSLDSTPQTDPYPFPPMKDWSFTQHHPFKEDYPSHKRSVYLMTKRLTAASYFQTFDGADPNVCTSDRDQSVTSLQALYFVNDRFVHDQAERFAQSLLTSYTNDEARLDAAFRQILCRPPAEDERNLLAAQLEKLQQHFAAHRPSDSQSPSVWSSVVRSLLRLNEFLYID